MKNWRTGTSDCDLIAIRFPHVYEDVGGQTNDWDADLLQDLGHDQRRALAVFVQVKTGDGDSSDVQGIGDYFAAHCDYLLKRLGFWPKDDVPNIAERFLVKPTLTVGGVVLSKVVVIRSEIERRNPVPWIEYPLGRAVRFIKERMVKYNPEKYSARMFFPDSIIQFLADQAHPPQRRIEVPTDD